MSVDTADWREGRNASDSVGGMEVNTATARRKLSPASGEPWNNGDKSAAAPRFWSKLPVIVLFKHGPTCSAPDTAIPGNKNILSVANCDFVINTCSHFADGVVCFYINLKF